MLTLKSDPDNIIVAEIRHGKKKKTTPLYWHPVIKPELRNSIENLDYFFKNDVLTACLKSHKKAIPMLKNDCPSFHVFHNFFLPFLLLGFTAGLIFLLKSTSQAFAK